MDFRPIASSSAGNAYLLTCDGHPALLIEAGLPWPEIQRALGFEASKLAGVLVTHEHQDHCRSVLDAARAGVDVYLSPGTFGALKVPDDLRRRFRNIMGGKVMVGPWACGAFPVEHDAAEPVGFQVQAPDGDRLVYITDAGDCEIQFSDISHFAVECNHDQASLVASPIEQSVKGRIAANHMSLENCLRFLGAQDVSKVKGIWLLHLSDGHADAEKYRRAVLGLTGRPTFVAAASEEKKQTVPEIPDPPEGEMAKHSAVVSSVENKKRSGGATVLVLGGWPFPIYVTNPTLHGYLVGATGMPVELETMAVVGSGGRTYRDVVLLHRVGPKRFKDNELVEEKYGEELDFADQEFEI